MKKIIVIVFSILCFGVAKAHIVTKAHPFFTQKTFSVVGINPLKNYEVPFKFFPEKRFVYGPAPKAIAFQNKLMIETSLFTFNHLIIRKGKNGTATLLGLK